MLAQSTTQTTKVLRVNSIVDIPSTIECFALNNDKSILAVGRSDNSIELWTTDSWIQILKIQGNKNIDIRRLYLLETNPKSNTIDGLRLFSLGLNGFVIEWSINTLNIMVILSEY